jgi:hypothetical protein
MRKSEMGARAKKTKFTAVPRPPLPIPKKAEPQAPAIPELPQPEPIKLSADIRKGAEAPLPANGQGFPATNAPKAPTGETRLDLGCGQSPKEGYEGVDLYSKEARHKVDLFRFPWPWADSSVDAVYSSHFIEHIPMTYVCKKHGHEQIPCEGAQDLFFAFFDECYRIMKPGAEMEVITPTCRSERSFQDPTHRRFIAQSTFFYLNADWRKANKLDHYLAKCNFSGDVNFSFDASVSGRHEEVQKELFQHAWNVLHDWMVKLRAVKA